ncbi:MAG TPA: cellulase family glycosylhydrolase [Candidatus Binataceae bacterium]|nr:cellulase family glycosylhydrolase [Candidatus Binataceae bacterium]
MKTLLVVLLLVTTAFARPRWTEQQANAWYGQQPWLVGSNFIPKDASNQLEMWQAATFDPQEIDRELGWAEAIGMNTMRVFLHDLLWEQDAAGFKQRIDQFLTIAARHHIRPILVIFDSCWDPSPKLGKQKSPIPGVHNSRWVQSPGAKALDDPSQVPRLKAYVTGVIGAFANDQRILAWDVWNEPDNTNPKKDRKDKQARVEALLPQVFEWARSADSSQPLTSGVWTGSAEDWGAPTKWSATERTQLEESDVITFHNYTWPEDFQAHVLALQKLNRPVLCTEFMARSVGSTFDSILPLAKKDHVAAINWGLVAGKTQTNLPWESWDHPYVKTPPPIWFHEVFYPDGKPYREAEVELIRQLTSQ